MIKLPLRAGENYFNAKKPSYSALADFCNPPPAPLISTLHLEIRLKMNKNERKKKLVAFYIAPGGQLAPTITHRIGFHVSVYIGLP